MVNDKGLSVGRGQEPGLGSRPPCGPCKSWPLAPRSFPPVCMKKIKVFRDADNPPSTSGGLLFEAFLIRNQFRTITLGPAKGIRCFLYRSVRWLCGYPAHRENAVISKKLSRYGTGTQRSGLKARTVSTSPRPINDQADAVGAGRRRAT